MTQGVLPYAVEVVEVAHTVTGRAGLPLVLETLRALGLDRAIAEHVRVRERRSGYTEAERVETLILLLAAGGDCLDDIAVLQADGGLGRLVGRRFPWADTLRHFLYACHDERLIAEAQAQRPAGQMAYIPAENAAWYRLSLLTYNVLSALKSLALPPSLSAARPKRLRFTLFTLAGRLVIHAGRLRVRISAEAGRLASLIAARQRLALLVQGLPAG